MNVPNLYMVGYIALSSTTAEKGPMSVILKNASNVWIL